jgi:dipeptidyl-peptidase-4
MYTARIIASLTLILSAAAPLPGAEPAKDGPVNIDYLRKYGETRGFTIGRPVKPKPAPDGKSVLFLRAKPPSPKLCLFEFDVATRQTRELLAPEDVLKGEETLTPEEKARRERMRVANGGFTDFQLDEAGKQVLLSLSGRLFVYDRAARKARELTTGSGVIDPKFRPDGGAVAYVRDHDVFVFDFAAGKEQRVTTGGTEKKTHGLAEFVAQEEMDRFSGYWWSPDGKRIAYEEADADGVEVWHVADPFRPEGNPQSFFYPRPGKANVKARLGIVPVSGGDTVWVDWDVKRYEYLAGVRWDARGPLTITVEDRTQQDLALLRVDPATGKTAVLARDSDATWVNLHQDVPRWLDDGDFLWTVQTLAGPQLQRYRPDGSLRTTVVPAALNFRGVIAVLDKKNVVVCQSGIDPTTAYVARFPLNGGAGKPDWVHKGPPGMDTACYAKDGSVYVLTSTTPRQMPVSRVYASDDRMLGELPSVAEEPPYPPDVSIQKVGRGEGFWTAVVRPRHFDAQKRYPVLVYVYGGPTALLAQSAMANYLIPQWLADQGFIVAVIDNRGTPHRGRDWERAVYGKFGSVPLEDQIGGLRALGEKFPEMDLERIGIYGWSFGGYMSALGVLRRPDVFKAAIAGAPVTDWEDYDTHYTERYLGLPKDSAAAYKEASLLTYAAELKRPLLLVHGTADDNVYFRHSLRLADALFRAEREFDLLPLSGLTHRGPASVPQYLFARYAAFFHKHLGTPEERRAPQ